MGIGEPPPKNYLRCLRNISATGRTSNGTVNGTTGTFDSLSTTGNTNAAIPSIESFGGTGD